MQARDNIRDIMAPLYCLEEQFRKVEIRLNVFLNIIQFEKATDKNSLNQQNKDLHLTLETTKIDFNLRSFTFKNSKLSYIIIMLSPKRDERKPKYNKV